MARPVQKRCCQKKCPPSKSRRWPMMASASSDQRASVARPSGSTATSSSMTQNHSAPSSKARSTPAEKPPAPPVFSSMGTYSSREVPPSASGSSVVGPQAASSSAANEAAICAVRGEFSLSTTTTRHAGTVSFLMDSKSWARSSWRLKVTMTMAGLLISSPSWRAYGRGRAERLARLV